DSTQYTRLLQKLSVRLDAMGLSDIRFVGPSAASIDSPGAAYIQAMRANSTVMSKVDHFAIHNYGGSVGVMPAAVQGSGRNIWMTETAKTVNAWSFIGQNMNSVQIWDAYDAVYNHAIRAGRGSSPGNDNLGMPALIAYN